MDLSSYDNFIFDQKNFSVGQEAIECVISDIVGLLAIDAPVQYCPFCVTTFASVVLLRNHLSTGHSAFLWELTTRSIELHVCPFCPGKFAGARLIARHSLHTHSNVLVDAFFPKCDGLIKCMFCEVSYDLKLMVQHLEEHTMNYEDWFKSTFPLQSGGIVGLVNVTNQCTNSQNAMQIDSLQEQLQNLVVRTSAKPKSILKSPRSKSKLPVRRVLSFSDDDEENQPGQSDGKARASWNSVLRHCAYQCGKCAAAFSDRKRLVYHVKKDHRRPKLHPFYQCSLCNAKFYKSIYLEKHCVTHSVLKSPTLLR